MNSKAFIIGVSGGSGSGKSTFALELQKLLPNSYYLSADKHYKEELPKMISPMDGKEYPDWNHPTSLKLFDVLEELHKAESEFDYVIIDGAFIFCIPEIFESLSYKIFIDATIEMRLFRRIKRNLTERGHTLDFIGTYYLNCARFREKEYCLPSREKADLIVDNENGFKGADKKTADIILNMN